MPTVTFLPSYRKIDVERGCTILDAAQRAGLNVNVVCGGQGKCGKCVMFVQAGKTSFDLQKYFRFFNEDEIRRGACLACVTSVDGDIQVTIPESSLIQEQKILITREDLPIEFRPSVRKFYVQLQPPSLADPSPDLSRLLWGIQKSGGPVAEKMYAPLEVLREIPGILRTVTGKSRARSRSYPEGTGSSTSRRMIRQCACTAPRSISDLPRSLSTSGIS